MKELEKLSFENIKVVQESNYPLPDSTVIYVLDDNNECLAKADCNITSLNDFVSDWFSSIILKPEINYFFIEIFNDEERKLTDSMNLDEYISYINKTYGEDEASTLNELYNIYLKLEEYISENILNGYTKCVCINSINSTYDNTGAGTLIVDYLKENYELIFLYGTEEAEGYWLDKVNFKEIINGFMYWTDNEKLNNIL